MIDRQFFRVLVMLLLTLSPALFEMLDNLAHTAVRIISKPLRIIRE